MPMSNNFGSTEIRFGNATISLRPPSLGSLAEVTADGPQNFVNSEDRSANLAEKLEEYINEVQVDEEKIVVKEGQYENKKNNTKIVDLQNAMELKNLKILSKDYITSYENLVKASMKMMPSKDSR